jgi:hypothetical protein
MPQAQRRSLLVAVLVIFMTLVTWLASAGEVKYQYDAAGRLRKVIYSDTSQKDYTLDAAGNRVQTQANPGAGLVQFTVASASVAEASGQYALTVTRTLNTNGAISVTYATQNGSAQAGVDYTAVSGTLSWANGDGGSRTISVPLLNNQLFQPAARSFDIALGSPNGGALLDGNVAAQISIVDDDPVFFSVSPTAQIGEAGGSAQITVTKSGGTTTQAYSVSYATADGTEPLYKSVAGQDYTASSGTLTFASNQATQAVMIAITNDAVYELNERLTLQLSNPTGGTAVSANGGTSSITIVENDPAPVFSIISDDASRSENIGIIGVLFTKTGATELSFTIPLATTGTALPSSDFTVPAVVVFPPQTTLALVEASIVDDATFEGNETLSVKLGTPPFGGSLGDDTVNFTIVENDSQPGAPPATPTGFSAFPTFTGASLSWNPVDTATRYEAIEVSAGQIYSGPNTAASYPGVPFQTYSFYVQACNSFGCGVPTEVIDVTVSCNPLNPVCEGGGQLRTDP